MELKYSFLTIAILIFCLSCNNRAPVDHAPTELIVEIPEDFPAFYEQFHADSSYQMDHIIFPLQEKPDGTKYTKEEWVMHRPLEGGPEDYNMDFNNFADIITETISDTIGIFNMERRFSKMDGEWQLIYYKVKTKVFTSQ